MRHRPENWGPYVAGMAVALSFIMLVASGVYSFHHQRHVNHQLCMQTVDNRRGLRVTWEAARDLVLRGQTTPQQVERTDKFFNAILETIPPLECIDNKPVVKEEQ